MRRPRQIPIGDRGKLRCHRGLGFRKVLRGGHRSALPGGAFVPGPTISPGGVSGASGRRARPRAGAWLCPRDATGAVGSETRGRGPAGDPGQGLALWGLVAEEQAPTVLEIPEHQGANGHRCVVDANGGKPAELGVGIPRGPGGGAIGAERCLGRGVCVAAQSSCSCRRSSATSRWISLRRKIRSEADR